MNEAGGILFFFELCVIMIDVRECEIDVRIWEADYGNNIHNSYTLTAHLPFRLLDLPLVPLVLDSSSSLVLDDDLIDILLALEVECCN